MVHFFKGKINEGMSFTSSAIPLCSRCMSEVSSERAKSSIEEYGAILCDSCEAQFVG